MTAKKRVPKFVTGAKAKTHKGMTANYKHMTGKGKPRKQAVAAMLHAAGKGRKR